LGLIKIYTEQSKVDFHLEQQRKAETSPSGGAAAGSASPPTTIFSEDCGFCEVISCSDYRSMSCIHGVQYKRTCGNFFTFIKNKGEKKITPGCGTEKLLDEYRKILPAMFPPTSFVLML